MNLNRRVCLIALVTCIMTLIGCSTIIEKDKNTINPALLEPQAVLKFNDVPIPVGFTPIPQESYSFDASGFRVALLKYQGKANADQVVNFYKEQMVMHNWNLLNVVEYGQRLMNFDKESETCIITLFPKGNNATLITISIGPKAIQQLSKRSKPLK